MNQNNTRKDPEYYYSPRFHHFNIYKRGQDGSGIKVGDATTQEEARKKVYELNGWNYKPKTTTP